MRSEGVTSSGAPKSAVRIGPATGRPRVVIVGAGFGGLYLAKSLKKTPVDVTVIDKRNFHLFQPLLYQVATGGLSPGDIASPIRSILKQHRNTRVVQGEVTSIDPENKRVCVGTDTFEYDTLVLATGSSNHYFGHDEWEELAPGLKTIEDAVEIRRRVFSAFERAELCDDERERKALLTFVIVGGGPTGVELAGALAEIANETLKNDFRNIDSTQARIYLLEGGDRVLAAFPPALSKKAEKSLGGLKVTPIIGAMVTEIKEDGVNFRHNESEQFLESATVLWAAGITASPVGRMAVGGDESLLDRSGRVKVEPNLSVPGHPDLFVIGDLAYLEDKDGRQLPGVAPVAMSQGRYLAGLIRAGINGQRTSEYRYRDKGLLATIGRAAAVADLGPLKFSGLLAWLLWLFVHLMYLVEFDNRLLVLTQWAWNYFTRNRGARLITNDQ